MENRWVSLGFIILILIFTAISGCFEDEPVKNAPPKIRIQVAETVYNNTSFSFNVFLEDPDGNITQSRNQWDFDNDGIFDWDSEDEDSYLDIENGFYRQSHFYGEPGKYTASLKVTDEDGKEAEEECNITVISSSISLKTSLDKSIYMIDEPIILTASLMNSGPISINVSEMSFNHPTLGRTEITTPEGYIIQSYLYVACLPAEVPLENGGEYKKDFDLTQGHWGIWDGEHWTQYNLTQRGKYVLQVIYYSFPHGETFNGIIKTEPITFVLV
jgi:hypothetical protein